MTQMKFIVLKNNSTRAVASEKEFKNIYKTSKIQFYATQMDM
jgi:predicted GIY-YIG superfamily endonuclease